MKTEITTIVKIKVKDTLLELTLQEARELAGAINRAVEDTEKLKINTSPDIIKKLKELPPIPSVLTWPPTNPIVPSPDYYPKLPEIWCTTETTIRSEL